jgi:L-seryl-tRNA(Ser) seleniumtransferase
MARQANVPILVDCAAERLSDEYLKRGASLVAYSGGKLLRGPQCAGLLLGRKDLVQAAWLNAAPHHAFGRPMKVGKEEMMGMLAAVEMWKKRDHEAEWRCGNVGGSRRPPCSKRARGVGRGVYPGDSRSALPARARQLGQLQAWPHRQGGGETPVRGRPRIRVARATGTRGDGAPSSFLILPVMMSPGEETVVAERSRTALEPASKSDPPPPTGPPANVAGNGRLNLISSLGPLGIPSSWNRPATNCEARTRGSSSLVTFAAP